MSQRPRRGRRSRGRDSRSREWVGGRFAPPFFITDREEPYRPDAVFWVEAGDGPIVGQDVVGPEEGDRAVARVLLTAFERPFIGPPRRPDRIRVADAALAAEVRAALRAEGIAIPVAVAPTPELDALLDGLIASLSGGDGEASYLEDGRVSAPAVRDLFRAAELLFHTAPWRLATDDQVLRMDIPALGIAGACVCIIGNLGESLGLVIFPSLAGYERFSSASDGPRDRRGRIDLGSDHLVLGFERGAELPARMRREVSEHRWPVADPNAYPVVERRERDGASRPLVERDVKIASAAASAFVAFFAVHRELFAADEFEPACESYYDERDLEVRFTFPYEAFPEFEVEDAAPGRDVAAAASAPPPARRKVGRNEPCPCGSGRKYKKCHLPTEEAAREVEASRASMHDLDGELVRKLGEFAMRRFGAEWLRFAEDFVDAGEALQLAIPWSVFHYRVQGATVASWFLRERGPRLSAAERDWLAAQSAAWLSVWEVIEVEPGASVTLRDLLTEEVRRIREVSGSRTLVVRDAVLARVVDGPSEPLLCGSHHRPLPPIDAAEVVRRARGRLRRKRAVAPERLREEDFGRYLIARWEKAVAALDERAAAPLDLHNTDGDALLLTTDHFAIESGNRAEVERSLAHMEGVEAPEPDQHPRVYDFLRPGNLVHASWENTLIGRVQFSEGTLQIETNSRERADALRKRVEAACGDLIRHRAREHSDPLSPPVAEQAARRRPPEPPPPEAEELVLEFKRRHYADWADHALPALGGLSPREAVRTARGRGAVDVLLKDMENHERRSSGATAFDFAPLREDLGLE